MKKILLISLLASTGLANAGDFTMSTGIDYTSGKYGQSSATDITAAPVVGKYTSGPITLKASMAYLTIKGPSNVIGTGDGVTVNPSATPGTSKTVSGWGDLVLSSSYSVYERNGWLVDVTGKAKIATADETKGLSTGKNDYSALVDVYKTIDKTTVFGGVGHKWVGVPTGANYRDVWQGTAGVSQKVSQNFTVGTSYDYAQSIVPGKQAREEVTLFAVSKLNKDLKLQVYGVAGLNDNSAKWGGGALLSYSY